MTRIIAYDRTISTVDIGVDDWWEFFHAPLGESRDLAYFNDLPGISGATIRVIVSGFGEETETEIGRLVLGSAQDIGVTLSGVQSRLEDFSIKERDAFGNLRLVPRRTIRMVDYDFAVESNSVDSVQRQFINLAATPALYIGEESMPETFVFGVFASFSVLISGYCLTECAALIEEF